jgi:hypothetical protein
MANGYDRYGSRRSNWLTLEPGDDVHAVDIGALIAGVVAYVRAVLRKESRRLRD